MKSALILIGVLIVISIILLVLRFRAMLSEKDEIGPRQL